MPQTITYKNHIITISHEITEEHSIYTCKGLDESGAPVVSLQYFYNSMPIIDPYEGLLEEAKKQIDNKDLSTKLFKTYRKNGLKYMSSKNPMSSVSFVKGETKYQFSHTCEEARYHYVAMPIINIGDFVQFEDDGPWWQIRFVNFSERKWAVYYAINEHMGLKKFSTVRVLRGHMPQNDAPSTYEIGDKNDRALSIRLPSYVYEILQDEVNARAGYGLNMNSTIRECLMYAIDQYFVRKVQP